MAYTGVGTQTDPYIVDNWEDMETLMTESGCYIKWADGENKVVEAVSMRTTVAKTCYAREIDFNGWTFNSLSLTGTASNTNSSAAWYTENALIKNAVFKVITLNRIWDKWISTQNFSSSSVTFESMYFDEIKVNNTLTSSELSNLAELDYVYSFVWSYFATFNNCIMHFSGAVSKPVSLPRGEYHNCEIVLDVFNNTGRTNVFFNYVTLDNCYISGNIDCSLPGAVYLTRTFRGGTVRPDSCLVTSINTIFNFTTSAAGKDDYTIDSGAATFVEKTSSIFIDDGHFTSGATTALYGITGLADDLKSTAFLRSKSFAFSADDGVRYEQFNAPGNGNWAFRIDPKVNGGIPFLPFWKYPVPGKQKVEPVSSKPFIRVHDSITVREAPDHNYDFTTNGMRIIQPISCTVTEELNGLYMCELEHPIDEWGDWLTLSENNILAVPILYHGEEKTQLFRIRTREVSMSSGAEYRLKVTAYHIFYDLSARAILSAKAVDLNARNALTLLFNSVFTRDGYLGHKWYPYEWSSDITDATYTAEYENVTLTEAIMGLDSSLINQLNGELYRDNFYFSINKTKEYAVTDAEPIVYGVNMLEITETVDWSNYCNYVRAYDNFENWHDVAYADYYSSLGDIVGVIKCNYKEPDADQLEKDMFTYFAKVSQPIVNYKVKFADLRNTDLYKDFLELKSAEVGDVIPITNQRLKIETKSKVIRKVYDVLTQKTTEIELGEQKGSIVRRSFMSDIVFKSTPDVAALQQQIKKLS